MSEKEEKLPNPKNPDNEFVREVIAKISKIKDGEKKNSRLRYKTKSKFAPKKNASHKAFKARALELKAEGKTADEVAMILETLAMRLDVVEKKSDKKESATPVPEPSPVIDPPSSFSEDQKKTADESEKKDTKLIDSYVGP
jgi:hypothetical protein